MVEKAQKEVENTIREAGEQASFDAGVHGLHPEIIRLLGRLKYRTSYGQNVLKHAVEVSHLAGVMATELGADVKIARRAGLLHDLGKSIDHEVEGPHVEIGVDIARKYKESKEVLHAMEAHHGDVEPETVEAVLVQAADAISAARPGARRETLESYIKRLEKLEEIANSFTGVERSFAIQAGREISEAQMIHTARDIVKKIESELDYPGQIKVNIIRETRAVEYAK
jgi:ribonuclease Y